MDVIQAAHRNVVQGRQHMFQRTQNAEKIYLSDSTGQRTATITEKKENKRTALVLFFGGTHESKHIRYSNSKRKTRTFGNKVE